MKLSVALLLTSNLVLSTAFIVNPVEQRIRTKPSAFSTHISVATHPDTDILQDASSSSDRPPLGVPGTADLDWKSLGFEFRPTKSNLRITYRDGEWGEFELCEVSLLLTWFWEDREKATREPSMV